MTAKTHAKKGRKRLEQGRSALAKGAFAEAEAAAREVLEEGSGDGWQAHGLLGEVLFSSGRIPEALAVYREAQQSFPQDGELWGRVGTALLSLERMEEALGAFEKAHQKLRKDPVVLTHFGFTLMKVGQTERADEVLGRAIAAGAGPTARLFRAVAWGRLRRYQEAMDACLRLESAERGQQLDYAAKSVRADCLIFAGQARQALDLMLQLREAGRLDPAQMGRMAYAAELSGDSVLCDQLIQERLLGSPGAEEHLLFAQIANLRGNPEQALEHLHASDSSLGERHPGHAFEVAASRGRALRLLGRADEAKRVLSPLQGRPEAASTRLGPKVFVDLGHLSAEEGNFEEADRFFREALKLDAEEPEGLRGLELTKKKLVWRDEMEESARARVEAAHAEAEAMRRRYSAREGEMDALRAELEKLKASQREAEERARHAQVMAARATAHALSAVEEQVGEKLQQELRLQEEEIEQKARVNLERAFEGGKDACPDPIYQGLLVAERTFQRSLYTELPAAAVAVLYAGALERALYVLFVEHFRQWLNRTERLQEFLDAAVRERRGTRVEYFDHFVEAFDTVRPGKAPSLGEVGRILGRRHEPYLKPFRDFIEETYGVPDPFYEELASFVRWGKEQLRDPVAHGRGDEVGYEVLRKFREEFLFSLGDSGRGMLATLFTGRSAT